MNKPVCPECGSKNIISKGVSWLCKDCGRWFKKKRRDRVYEPKYEGKDLNKGKPLVLE